MMGIAFTYIAVAGWKCKDPSLAATSWMCDGLLDSPETALVLGIVGAVIFWGLFAVFYVALMRSDDAKEWVSATWGITGIVTCVVAIPVFVIMLYSYGWVSVSPSC